MRSAGTRALSRIERQVDLNYEVAAPGADFVFNVHAAHTPSQSLSAERLVLHPAVESQTHTDPATRNRYLRVHAAPGTLALSYGVTVDLMHHRSDPALLEEVPIGRLPLEVLGYLYPSRYCQSDRLLTLASDSFGPLKPGFGRVQAIRDWVKSDVKFTSNSSNSNTSALDTLIDRVGVCRDFAHLMIALCRAMNIPARYATGTDYGSDPALGPPDFRAYVEVYLGAAGTSSIRQAPPFRWASYGSAPGATRLTWLSPPSSATSVRIGRSFGRWPSRTRGKAWCDRINAPTRFRRTAVRHARQAAESSDRVSHAAATLCCSVRRMGVASSRPDDTSWPGLAGPEAAS